MQMPTSGTTRLLITKSSCRPQFLIRKKAGDKNSGRLLGVELSFKRRGGADNDLAPPRIAGVLRKVGGDRRFVRRVWRKIGTQRNRAECAIRGRHGAVGTHREVLVRLAAAPSETLARRRSVAHANVFEFVVNRFG